MPRIVLAGGSGELGRLIAAEIQRQVPTAQIVIGDHRPERGAQTAARFAAQYAYLDAEDRVAIERAVERADLVLVALGQHTPLIQQVCAQLQIPCVDVTVDTDLIDQIRDLDPALRATGTSSVVMAGLYPGISGLLAHRAARELDEVIDVDVALLQHTNARAGRRGVEDMLRLICQPVPGPDGPAPGFRRRFPGGPWLRRVDSAERAGLRLVLGAARVDYWTGWNERFFTAFIAALVRLGALPALAPALARLRRHRPGTPEPIELRVRVRGRRAGVTAICAWSLVAESDYAATATAAVGLGAILLAGAEPGVHTPAELTTLGRLLPSGTPGVRVQDVNSRSR